MSSRTLLAVSVAGFVAIALSVVVVSILVEQDWSQYAANVISGALIAGFLSLIVAALLANQASQSTRLSLAREIDESWRVSREQVKSLLGTAWGGHAAGPDQWDWEWNQVRDFVAHSTTRRVLDWAPRSPENRELALAQQVLALGSKAYQEARNLDELIAESIDALRPGSAFNDDVRRACWTSLRGGSIDAEPETVSRVTTQVLSAPSIANAARAYFILAHDLRSATNQLWARLDVID